MVVTAISALTVGAEISSTAVASVAAMFTAVADTLTSDLKNDLNDLENDLNDL